MSSRVPSGSLTQWILMPAIAVLSILPAGAAVNIRIQANGPVSLSQGNGLLWKAKAINTSPSPATVGVTFFIQNPALKQQDFQFWSVTVPGNGSAVLSPSPVTSSQWFPQIGAFKILAKIGGVQNGTPLSFTVTSPTVVVPKFQPVNAATGINVTLPGDLNTSHAAGAAWADIESDGDLDLYVTSRSGSSTLWINDGASHFTEQAVARGAGNTGAYGISAVFADYDNDGDPDLYVVNDALDPLTALPTLQGDRLYVNDGSGHFTDSTATAFGVAASRSNGRSASWGDYDSDGNLDLYVTIGNAFNNDANPPGPPMNYAAQDHLYRNNGDGTFSDMICLLPADPTAPLGFCGTSGSGFETVFFDYDQDGDQDIYIAQDYFLPMAYKDKNRLYRNDGYDPSIGNIRFRDACGLDPLVPDSGACIQINAMGVGVGDYNSDGWQDLAVSNVGANGGNQLLKNNANGTFTNVSSAAGIERKEQSSTVRSTTWGIGFFDFNNDGFEDIFAAAGDITDLPDQPDQLFVNQPSFAFLDLTAPAGAGDKGVGHGIAFADYDHDGRVDNFIVNSAGQPHLLRNVTTTGSYNWLELDLIGVSSNRDGCGARVVLNMNGFVRVRTMMCGSVHGSGSDSMIHFGLNTGALYTLDVYWPSGVHQVFAGQTLINQLVHAQEDLPNLF